MARMVKETIHAKALILVPPTMQERGISLNLTLFGASITLFN